MDNINIKNIFINNNNSFKMENNKNISSTSKKLACELVAKIIKPLFKKLGYIDYESELWILNIK